VDYAAAEGCGKGKYELKYSAVFFRTNEMLEDEPEKFWRNVDKKKVGQIEGFVDKRKAI
jgi:hypothetical protein